MNIIDRVLSSFGYTKTHTPQDITPWLSAHAVDNEHFRPNPEDTKNLLEIYRRVSWIEAAVRMVGDVAATTPIGVYRRSDDGDEAIDNHPFEELLRRPNPLMSRHEFIFSTLAWYLVAGNCYWWLNKANETAQPDEMWIIPAQFMRPVPDGNMFLRGYIFDQGTGEEIPIEAHEVCHFKYNNLSNMYVGQSPLLGVWNTAIGDMKATEWNKNFFSEHHAKPSGMLTVSKPMGVPEWKRFVSQFEKNHGGTDRRVMLVQNTEQAAIDWINTSISQSDMQFLELRKASRDEIFNTIATGSAAMVDVNATEANSRTGEDVFYSLGVHPRLNVISEKITKDIMPLYGEGLKAAFDDVRRKDVQLELNEIVQAEHTHTIDEIRNKFYQMDSIGDERGSLLFSEVGTVQPEPVEIPDGLSSQINAVIDEVKSLKLSLAPPQSPTTITINHPEQTEYKVSEPKQIDGPTQAETDLSLWRKKATNRARKARSVDVPFDSDNIPNPVHLWTGTMLRHAESIEDVNSVFDYAAKLMLQLNPDDDEEEQKVRMPLEERAADRLEEALANDLSRLESTIAGNIDPSDVSQITAQLLADSSVQDVLRQALIESVDLGVSVAVDQLDQIALGFDWTLANAEAREWARVHTGEAIGGINETTRRMVREATSEWINNGQPLSVLIDELTPVFNRSRAELIASTEVTQAYAQGSLTAYQQSGVVAMWQWRTANDELVCPQCGPLEGVQARLGEGFGDDNAVPPKHPRCRCWVAPIVE